MRAAFFTKNRTQSRTVPSWPRYHRGKSICALLGIGLLSVALDSGTAAAVAGTLDVLRAGQLVKRLESQNPLALPGESALGPRVWGEYVRTHAGGSSAHKDQLNSSPLQSFRGFSEYSRQERVALTLKAFSDILEPLRAWNDFLTWFKAYKSLPAAGALPELRGEQIDHTFFLMEIDTGALVPTAGLMSRIRGQSVSAIATWENKELQRHLRVSWSNRELDQWVNWTQERDHTLVLCTDRLREMLMRDGPELLSAGFDSDRLKSLLGWASVVAVLPGTPDGRTLDAGRLDSRDRAYNWTLKRLGLQEHPKLQNLQPQESQMIFRALALALIPNPSGGDIEALWRVPMDAPAGLIARLDSEGVGKSRDFLTDWLETYRNYRDMDQPGLPVHPAPHPESVHVAFIDTGVDWKEHPELGEYLGLGRQGELSQYDFADSDENPWVPAVGDLAHGSGVMATLLTLIAHQEPRILEDRRLDMALWKTASIRSLLAVGTDPDLRRFDMRQELSYMQAFTEAGALSELRTQVIPDIVSISSSFPLRRATLLEGSRAALKSSPWVWVMAAGNGGRELNFESGDPSCMGDLPADLKPDARLICVGALKRGILRDSISKYSNYGPLVDLYTFESFSGLCPSGTSCSTPAISAALAMLKAKYTSLTAEQLKQVLLEASSEKSVEQEVDGQKRNIRVRVFDPTTMMSKAYLIASRVVRNRPR